MPARPKAKKRAPRATFAKRMRHTFYLVQPALQFAALVMVMVFLSRCSPLAPSTDKVIPGAKAPASPSIGTGNQDELLKENLISKSLEEITRNSLLMVSENSFEELNAGSLQSEQSAPEPEMREYLNLRSKRLRMASRAPRSPLLTINLSDEQQQALLRDGKVRINLALHLSGFELKAKRLLFKAMKEVKLAAKSYLVVADDAAQNSGSGEAKELPVALKISIALLSDEQVILEIVRLGDDPAQNALLPPVPARKLAVVLE